MSKLVSHFGVYNTKLFLIYNNLSHIIGENDVESLRDQETALITLGELYRDEG